LRDRFAPRIESEPSDAVRDAVLRMVNWIANVRVPEGALRQHADVLDLAHGFELPKASG